MARKKDRENGVVRMTQAHVWVAAQTKCSYLDCKPLTMRRRAAKRAARHARK